MPGCQAEVTILQEKLDQERLGSSGGVANVFLKIQQVVD